MTEENISRRNALKAAGAAGVAGMAGVAGCSDLFSSPDVTIASTSSGSSSYETGQALNYAASEHDADVDISIQTSEGWTANLYAYEAGDFNTISVDNNSLSKALNEEADFEDDPVDEFPMQGFIFTSLEMFIVKREGADLETVQDLRDGDYDIYPIEPGFGTRLMTEEVLQEAGIYDFDEEEGIGNDNEINDADTTDIAEIIEEQGIDAIVLYGQNGVSLASWCDEVVTQNDLEMVETDEEFAQTIEELDGASLLEASDPVERYDIEEGIDEGMEVAQWSLDGQWAFGSDVDPEHAYEIAEICMDHYETMRESDDSVFAYGDDPEIFTNAILEDHPVHPGIVDFLKDEDLWNDDWEEGEIDE